MQAAIVVLAIVGLALGQETDHPCARRCIPNQDPMICEYDFRVEWYVPLSKACYQCPFVAEDCYRPHCITGDGNRRAMTTVNRQLPGPVIEVCHNDTVRVKVDNAMQSEAFTIHWHGIHQRGTPYADGTWAVTQCPINLVNSFTYEFKADPIGSHFYHAHTFYQTDDGLFGPIIVHDTHPGQEPHKDLYDNDCDTPTEECGFIVMINEWFDRPFIDVWSVMYHYKDTVNEYMNITGLINGRGRRVQVYNEDDENPAYAYTPLEVFEVQQGKVYRFRIIGSTNFFCPLKVSVEGHMMTVIAADGHPVKPREVDVLSVWSGERYDVVVEMREEPGNYWFKAHAFPTLRGCTSESSAYAILRYEGQPEEDPPGDREEDRRGYFLQPYLSSSSNPMFSHGPPFDINADELDNAVDEDHTDEVVDVTYYLTLDANPHDNTRINHPDYYPTQDMPSGQRYNAYTFDNITFWYPSVPVLSQPDDFDPDWLCDRDSINHDLCQDDLCLCVHFLAFPQDAVVELILINQRPPGHPMHLHGYSFRYLGTERFLNMSREWIVEKNEAGELPKKLVNPSYRDTITLHDRAYTVLRFKADNPGYWAIHCHIADHLDMGQAVLIRVGDPDDFPPPPADYPRCGDWEPDSVKQDKQSQPKPINTYNSRKVAERLEKEKKRIREEKEGKGKIEGGTQKKKVGEEKQNKEKVGEEKQGKTKIAEEKQRKPKIAEEKQRGKKTEGEKQKRRR